MVHSMTAFARVEKAGAQGTLSWELRSVNSRYLEPHCACRNRFATSKARSVKRCARVFPAASWNAPCVLPRKPPASRCRWIASAPRNWSPPLKPSPA